MERQVNRSLPEPVRYFPIENGRYEVKPGLRKFRENVFQIDRQFDEYRQSKQTARAQRLSKYFAVSNLDPDVERFINQFIFRRLVWEHPTLFALTGDSFTSGLTGETLRFSSRGDYLGRSATTLPAYVSGMDALAAQVQEDLAVMSTDGDRHWLSAVHLCSPNHWSAEEKIGKSFAAIHEPVAGIEAINSRENEWVRTMINAVDGLERFAWGIATDDKLNHHPDDGAGRQFDRANPCAFLRVERQTIWGFPEVDACLFTIRTSFVDCAEIRTRRDERESLLSAIESMTPESLRYKGMEAYRDDLRAWLKEGANDSVNRRLS